MPRRPEKAPVAFQEQQQVPRLPMPVRGGGASSGRSARGSECTVLTDRKTDRSSSHWAVSLAIHLQQPTQKDATRVPVATEVEQPQSLARRDS